VAVLLLITVTITGCSSTTETRDPYNPADDQRSRAGQAQDELSSETSGNK
jgi:hypothetical protein